MVALICNIQTNNKKQYEIKKIKTIRMSNNTLSVKYQIKQPFNFV